MHFKAIFRSKIFLVLLSWLSSFSVYFLVLPRQSSLLILYRNVVLHQPGPIAKYSPRCKDNTDDHLNCYFLPVGSQYWIFLCVFDNVWHEFPWIGPVFGNSLGLLCSPFYHRVSFVIIQIQYLTTQQCSHSATLQHWVTLQHCQPD